jgi:putative nucleotidyltransferase with HDIG domain
LDERSKPALIRYLPQVTVATLLVAVCPAVAVWEINSAGWITSVTLSGALGLALALGASFVGRLYWSSRPGSGDLLFSELMLWGWLRRLWIERRLDKALRLLESEEAHAELGSDRRAELLTELAAALEARDPYTSGHSHRVARHAATIAKRMGLSRHDVADVRAAALVHDVGKLTTPNAVLRKAGDLTADEFAVIKEHPVCGAEMVSKLGNDRLTAMVRYHHERLDGSGYPSGLVGGEIPLGARIIAVADTFDAVTSSRPYRPARSHRAAIAILHEQAGTRLDPGAVRAFDSHYSGRRPLAVWVALTNVPTRLLSWLGGGATAAAGSAVRTVATAAVTGAAAVTAVAGYEHRPASAFDSGHGTVEISSLVGAHASGSSAEPVAVAANAIVNVSATAIAQVDFRKATVLGASTTQDLSQTVASPSLVDVVGSLTGSPIRGQAQLPPSGVGRGTGAGAVTGGLPGRETAGIPVDPGSLGSSTTGQSQTVGDNSQTTGGNSRSDGTTTGTDSSGSGSSSTGSSSSWDSSSSTGPSSSSDTSGTTGTSGSGDAVVDQTPTTTSAPTDTQTQPPVTTQAPDNAQTLPPVAPTQTPADTQTQPPADTTQTPADTTQTTPTDTSQTPATTTPAPTDTSQTPTDTSQTPTDTSQTPSDTTQTPSDAPADTSTDASQTSTDTQSTDDTQTSSDSSGQS